MTSQHPAGRHLLRLAAQAERDDDILTQPISLGLRLGQPAVASPETFDLPIWAGRPEVPAAPVYVKPRRSVRQFLADELPGALVVFGTVGATATVMAAYVTGAF